MRGKKVRRLRRIAVRAYLPNEATSGYRKQHVYSAGTYWGPQWRRFHRYLKRG